jgi:hypothetical protein
MTVYVSRVSYPYTYSYKTRHSNYYLPRPRAHWGKHQLYITHLLNLRGVSTNKTIICFIAMQTYKELILSTS